MEKIHKDPNEKRWVSYSQFSNWFNCRHRWYLDHVKGLREFEDNVNTCFGTAMMKQFNFTSKHCIKNLQRMRIYMTFMMYSEKHLIEN